MALTSDCGLFISVNEAGINQIVRHVMRQRPSLFNYGTDAVVRNPQLLCAAVDAAPAVFQRGNPLVTRQPPLPILATNPQVGLEYAVQVTEAEVDFSPGNVITLPDELTHPLAQQRIALHGQVCAGLGCPSDDGIKGFGRPPVGIRQPGGMFANRLMASQTAVMVSDRRVIGLPGGVVIGPGRDMGPGREVGGGGDTITVLPASQLECFCLDLFAVAHVAVSGSSSNAHAYATVDELDIVDIQPDGLENAILCYAKLALNMGILAGGLPIPDLTLNLTGLPVISAEPTPTSAAVPFNPAVEEDQVKLFVNVTPSVPAPTVVPCPTSGGGGGGGGGGGPTRTIGWGAGPAAPPGPEHLLVAVSADLVSAMFAAVRNTFHPCFSPSGSFGPFTARLAAGGHLENGNVSLANDGTISVTDLAVKWDTLRLDLDVDIPKICVGGFCIIPNPLGGCAVRAPELCVFEDNPDFTLPIDLSGLVTSRLTVRVKPLTKYGVETTRPGGMTDLDAEDAGIPNEWAVFLDPQFLHIEFVDIPDFVATLLTDAVDAAVDNVLGGLPGWAKDLIKSILGGAISIIRTLLGIPGDIVDWLSQLIGVDLDLFDLVTTALAQHFAKDAPLVQLEDPFPILGPQTSPFPLIPVKIPVRDLAVIVNADEMTLQAKVGA